MKEWKNWQKKKKEEWEKQVKARGGHVREEKFNPPYCCAVSVEIKKDGKVKLGWSGDSKAITLRDGEKLKEGATIMQNVAAKFVAGDAIEPEDYFNSPYNNQITGALGLASTKGTDKPEIKEFQGQNGDRIILASDGVWDMVSEEEVQALSEQYTAPQKLQEKIFQLALERNNAQQPFVIKTENKDGIMASVNMNAKFGRGDNITVQVVELRNIGVEHPAFIKEAPIETKQPPVAEEAEVFEAEPPIEIPAIPEIPRDRVDILTEELKKAQIELAEAIVNKDKNQGFFRGLFNKKAKQEAEERYATALDNKCRLEVELQQETEKRGSRLLEALKSHSKDFLDITAKQYEAKENVVSRAWKAMGGMNFGSLVSKLEARASDSTLIGQCVKEFAQKSKKVLEENKVARVVNQVASVRSVVSAGLLGGSVLGIPGFTSTRVAFGALGTGMGTRAGSDAIYNWYSRWFGRRADVFYTTQQAKQVWDEKMDKAGKLGKIYLKVMGKLHKKNFLSEEPETALENIDEAISAYESYAYVNNIPLEQVAKQDENYARLLQMQETAMEEIMAKMSEQAVSELGGWTNLDHVDIKVAEQYLDLHAERQKKQMDALLKNIKAERRAVAAKRLLSVAAGAAGGMLAAYYALKRVGKMTDLGAEAPPTEAPTPAESEVPTTKASAPEAPPSAEPSAPTPKPEPTAPESEPEVIGEPQAEAPEEISFEPEGEDVGIMNDILEEKKFFAIPKNFGFLRAAESFQTEYKDQLLEAVKTHAPKWFKQGMSDEQILRNWRVDVNGAHGGRIVPEGEWVKIEPKPNARMLISTEYPYLKLDESDPSLFKVHKKPFLRPRINK
ncbi:hypothetical protein KKA13_01705 [Patescibacteria group bacterium]|nr:hypothetical protein [Patescibacteria group bacterium]